MIDVRPRRSAKLLLCLMLLPLLCGCGTLVDITAEPHFYGGVRMDLYLLEGAYAEHNSVVGAVLATIVAIVDIPLCAILDTILLPLVLILDPGFWEEEDPELEELLRP